MEKDLNSQLILNRKDNILGYLFEVFASRIKGIWYCYHSEWRFYDMVFLGQTQTFHLYPTRQTRQMARKLAKCY